MKRETKQGLAVLGALLGTAGAIYAAARVWAAPSVQVSLDWHSDPEFEPGDTHTAIVTVSNPTEATWNYAVRLLIGDFYDQTQDILLAASDSGELSYTVGMPLAVGTYSVRIIVSNADTGARIRTFSFEAVDVIPPEIPLKGDLDSDGLLTTADLSLLYQAIATWRTPGFDTLAESLGLTPEELFWRADVNNDGEINSLDITALELLMGYEEEVGLTLTWA